MKQVVHHTGFQVYEPWEYHRQVNNLQVEWSPHACEGEYANGKYWQEIESFPASHDNIEYWTEEYSVDGMTVAAAVPMRRRKRTWSSLVLGAYMI